MIHDSTTRLIENVLRDLASGHSIVIVAFSIERALHVGHLAAREARRRSIPCGNIKGSSPDAPRIRVRRYHATHSLSRIVDPNERIHFDHTARFERSFSTPTRYISG